MANNLHWNTVSSLLKSGLLKFMAEPLFNQFRLVGGTSLSLQRGHRISIDIDLFTDEEYKSIDFDQIDEYLRREFDYVSPAKLPENIGMGTSYILGNRPDESFKLDLYYTDPFIFPFQKLDGIRLSTVEEIAAMKMDVIQRGGRKKDFWDLHELWDDYSIEHMIELHEKRYPYSHDTELIKTNLINFETADDDLGPICLRGKYWEIIKLDFSEEVKQL